MYTPIYPLTQPDQEHFNQPQKLPPHTHVTGLEVKVCVQGYPECSQEQPCAGVREARLKRGKSWGCPPCDAQMPEAPAQPTPHRALQSCPTLK